MPPQNPPNIQQQLNRKRKRTSIDQRLNEFKRYKPNPTEINTNKRKFTHINQPNKKVKVEPIEIKPLIGKRKRMTGRGVGIQPSPKYIQFGNKLINTHKLNQNQFCIRYMNGGNIVKFPTKTISSHLSAILRNMVHNQSPSTKDMDELTDDEKTYLDSVCEFVCIKDRFALPTPNKDEHSKLIDRLHLLMGQLIAGNNNKAIIKEIKQLLIQLRSKRLIPIQEANEIILDILTLEGD